VIKGGFGLISQPMKIAAFILSCYMLMLTTIPCADKIECNDLPAIAQAAD